MTPQELGVIAARVAAATKGPWGSHRDLAGVYTVQVNPRVIPGFGSVTEGDVAQILTREDDKAYANVRFIASAREDMPALIAEVERLTLSDTERAFLAFALDLAADQMYSRGDEFTDEDRATLDSLRARAEGGAQ